MADDWLRGVESGFQSSLQMQQLRSQNSLRRLQEQQIAQGIALKLQENNLSIQFRADMAKAISAAQEASSPKVTVRGPEDPNNTGMAPPLIVVDNPNPMRKVDAAMQFITPVIAQYQPEKLGTFVNDLLLNEVRMQNEQNFTPTAGQVTTPSGKSIDFVKTSPRSAQLVVDPTVENLQDPQTGRNISVLRTGTSGAKVIPQDIANRQVTQWALNHAPELMQMDEHGRAFLPPEKFNEAARRAGIPTGVKTDMLNQIATTAGAFEVGRKLLPLLTPENVGVRGAVSRKLVESGVAQMFPEMKIGSATETLSVASNFRAGLVRALRSDSNINKDEREQIIEGLPTPENMLSSVQDSKIKLATQLELAAIKSRAAANALGKQITPFFLTAQEIEQMIDSKSITPEEGAKIWNADAWNLIEQIRSEIQR